ncbi:MAG: glycoside hydrolase [Prevotella sp.]
MKKTLIDIILLCCLPIAAFAATDTYEIDIDNHWQKHEGWGVSLCWWANVCGKWDERKVDELVDWLVSPEGLNYNIFRYNIGGGDDPMNGHCKPHHMGEGKGLRAEMEGFKDSMDGTYIWNRDEGQRRILLKIKERRPDAIFEAFSNSAPFFMTYSGCCSGNRKAGMDNLKPENYKAFAQYLIDMCRHYKETYGIEFATLDPFNEPNTNYWYAGGTQEGCHFDPQSQVEFLEILAPMLQSSGLNTSISAPDETNVGKAIEEIHTYRKAGALHLVGQWNTHTYGGSIKEKKELGKLVREEGLRLWMSETGDGGKGIKGNLKMGQRLMDDIRYLQPDAWLDWQYVEEWNDQWCFVKAHFADQTYNRVKNYYVRQQFTKFIKAGYTFVESGCEQTLAAIDEKGETLVLVALNNSDKPRTHKAILKNCHQTDQAKAFVTDSEHDLQPTTAFRQNGQKMAFTLLPQSITTFVIPINRHSSWTR